MTPGFHDSAAGLVEVLRRRIDPREPRRRVRANARPVNHRRRMMLVVVGMVVVFGFLVARLVELQVVNPDHYQALGDAQRHRTHTLAAERGAILDRNGVELVMSRPMQTIVADPTEIRDPASAAMQIAPLLSLDTASVEQKLRGPGRFAYIVRKVDPEVADKVRALGIDGIAFVEESERYLPSGQLAQSVLGLVDIDNVGLSGLEMQYGQQLSGTPGTMTVEASRFGSPIAGGDRQVVPASKGDDIVLTIDRAIQYEVENILADQVLATGSQGAIAIVSRPETGEILAMANMVRDGDSDVVVPGTNNAALTTVYEPGSVMKMVTISAALEAGLVTPDTPIEVPPVLRVGDTDFQDAEKHGGMVWSTTQVFAHSSNIGTIKIAQQLGKQKIYDAVRAFGFGERTSVAFPGEQSGVVPEPDDWWSTSIGTIPIGQGVSVTPLQMLCAYNVVANGGVYVPPRLIDGTVGGDGQLQRAEEGERRRVLSEQTVNEMNLMMRDVVEEGTGQLAAVDGYTPAGKTGTSRKPQPTGGYVDKYGRTHYQSTFVGFVPAEHPALSVIVIMDDPTGDFYTGGSVAAPAFSRISSFALRYLGIAPPATDRVETTHADASSQESHQPTSVEPSGVTVESDGRVRVAPAGEAAPTTLVPATDPESVSTGPPSAGQTTSSPTRRR